MLLEDCEVNSHTAGDRELSCPSTAQEKLSAGLKESEYVARLECISSFLYQM